jgi:hypothetical protein
MSSWDVKMNDGWSHTVSPYPKLREPFSSSYQDRRSRQKTPQEYIDSTTYLSNTVATRSWAPQGPDPKGTPFLPYGHWAGIVDGYIFKTGEKGMGYYKSV